MEQAKQNLPKIAIATALGAIGAYILYQYFNKKEGAAVKTSSDPLTEVIDQRSSIQSKMDEAASTVRSYVE
jgi:hypothetical protein